MVKPSSQGRRWTGARGREGGQRLLSSYEQDRVVGNARRGVPLGTGTPSVAFLFDAERHGGRSLQRRARPAPEEAMPAQFEAVLRIGRAHGRTPATRSSP